MKTCVHNMLKNHVFSTFSKICELIGKYLLDLAVLSSLDMLISHLQMLAHIIFKAYEYGLDIQSDKNKYFFFSFIYF